MEMKASRDIENVLIRVRVTPGYREIGVYLVESTLVTLRPSP